MNRLRHTSASNDQRDLWHKRMAVTIDAWNRQHRQGETLHSEIKSDDSTSGLPCSIALQSSDTLDTGVFHSFVQTQPIVWVQTWIFLFLWILQCRMTLLEYVVVSAPLDWTHKHLHIKKSFSCGCVVTGLTNIGASVNTQNWSSFSSGARKVVVQVSLCPMSRTFFGSFSSSDLSILPNQCTIWLSHVDLLSILWKNLTRHFIGRVIVLLSNCKCQSCACLRNIIPPLSTLNRLLSFTMCWHTSWNKLKVHQNGIPFQELSIENKNIMSITFIKSFNQKLLLIKCEKNYLIYYNL